MTTASIEIQRLEPHHAPAIVSCFKHVYGDSYANEMFYDRAALADALARGRLCSVGALAGPQLLGHMAMTVEPGAHSAELGNTVVAPEARGSGLAWKIGSALSAWCVDLGYEAYLHYPTTDHHIMQRHSVADGFETGLMLGYVPAETDGQVGTATIDTATMLRGAATIVFRPLQDTLSQQTAFLPERLQEWLPARAQECGLPRDWMTPDPSRIAGRTTSAVKRYAKRQLERLEIHQVGTDIGSVIESFTSISKDCLHLDFALSDPSVDVGLQHAQTLGFVFCGWLPGYRNVDVLRMQKVDPLVTNMAPDLVNPTAQALLQDITFE